MCLVNLYLIIVPVINDPSWNYLFAVLFGIAGLIFYVPFILFSSKVNCFDRVTVFFQILFQAALTDKDI